MNELRQLLQENLNIELLSAVLSNPRKKDGPAKIKVRPLMKADRLFFQLELFQNHQAFHKNVDAGKACELILEYMENMKQMQLETRSFMYTVLVSKKGKVTIKRKAQKCEKEAADLNHNRKKKYVLEEGIPVPFLQDLGGMTTKEKSSIQDSINSGRLIAFWNLLKTYYLSLTKAESLRSWILDAASPI